MRRDEDASDQSNQWPAASLLGRLTVKSRQKLLTTGVLRRFTGGQVLISQGDRETFILLLMSGSSKVTAVGESGDEALLGIRVAGDLVGETAALQEVPRTATITACSDVVARQLTRAQFGEFLATHTDVAVELMNMILYRLQWANQRRVDFGRSALVRLSRVLVELAVTYGKDVREGRTLGVPLTQSELGSLAGMKLPTVEKSLGLLEKQDIVQRRYRQVVVVDMDRLQGISS
jgi:CRP/FNR family cyclic AMP-dependent transcriptional regulator